MEEVFKTKGTTTFVTNEYGSKELYEKPSVTEERHNLSYGRGRVDTIAEFMPICMELSIERDEAVVASAEKDMLIQELADRNELKDGAILVLAATLVVGTGYLLVNKFRKKKQLECEEEGLGNAEE